MAKEGKKLIRQEFRRTVFHRDNYTCVLCSMEHGGSAVTERALAANGQYREVALARPSLDAHHITDRNEMPHGGYVKANGITVCEEHHEAVEAGVPTAAELYSWIGSSFEEAEAASWRLKP